MTRKRRLGGVIVETFGVSPLFLRTLWHEMRAAWLRLRCHVDPFQIRRLNEVRRLRGVLANIGCGPTGQPQWVNVDLLPAPGVTVRFDCRRRLPLGDGSCRGIHVEHYLEHLELRLERPLFLADCRRCLEPEGILRIVVPDARKYLEAYVSPGWEKMNALTAGDLVPEDAYDAKIQLVNHTFLQDGEHFAGYDMDYLCMLLKDAGFRDVEVVDWRQGRFPGGCIDVETHRAYSLYMEARR